MDFVIYMTMAIFVISFAYILFEMTPQPKKKSIYERFTASTSQQDIQPTTSLPPPVSPGCDPKKSPWFDHRIIGFCEDERITTPGRLIIPNVSVPSVGGEIFATCINE
jgi:hypothetical protein